MGWILVLSGLVLRNSVASPAVVPQGRPHFPRCAQRASMNSKLIRTYKYSYIKWYQIYSDVIKWTDDFRMFTAARKHCHTFAEGPHAIPVGARRDPRRDLQRASCSKKTGEEGHKPPTSNSPYYGLYGLHMWLDLSIPNTLHMFHWHHEHSVCESFDTGGF